MPPVQGPTFHQPADIAAAYLSPEMADLPQEQLRVVLLDRRARLIDAPLVYRGGQAEAVVRFADCFREAVRRSAAAVVLVHNHPSGDPSASPEDAQVTHGAGQAGLLLGIAVLDHVILAREGFLSLRAQGLYVPPEVATAKSGSESESVPRCSTAEWLTWAYDCQRCGARVRGQPARRTTCQRCLGAVTPRSTQTIRAFHMPELPGPVAA